MESLLYCFVFCAVCEPTVVKAYFDWKTLPLGKTLFATRERMEKFSGGVTQDVTSDFRGLFSSRFRFFSSDQIEL